MLKDQKIELGDLIKDDVTGFTGIVIAKTTWLNGCVRYDLQSQKLSKEGIPSEPQWFDSKQVTLIKKGQIKVEGPATEGPQRDPKY